MKLKQDIEKNQLGNIGWSPQHYLRTRPWGSVALVAPQEEGLSSLDLFLISSIYREISHDGQGYFCEGAGTARFNSTEELIENIRKQGYLIPSKERSTYFDVTESAAEDPEEKRKLVITGVITPFKIEQDKDEKYSIRRDEANVRKFSSIQYVIDDLRFEQLAKLYGEESNKQALLEFNRIVHEAIPPRLQKSLLALRRRLIIDTCALIAKGEAPKEACLRVSMPILLCINNMLRTISTAFEERNVDSTPSPWIRSSEQEIQRSREALLPWTDKWGTFEKVLLLIVLAVAAVFSGVALVLSISLFAPVVVIIVNVLLLTLFNSAIFLIGAYLFDESKKEQAIKAVFDATKDSLYSSSENLIRCTLWQTPAVDPIGYEASAPTNDSAIQPEHIDVLI